MSAYSPTAAQRRDRLPRNPHPARRSAARAAAADSLDWLYPHAADVVRIETRAGRHASGETAPSAASVQTQVGRWRRRVLRARAVVLIGRHLSAALALVVVGLVVARLAGSTTDPLWAFAGAGVMLVSLVAALSMSTTDATVAGMLDSELGLFERVQTALELERDEAGGSRLARQVIAEAQNALAPSFSTARARPRNDRVVLLALAPLAIAVALLLALPGSSQPQHTIPKPVSTEGDFNRGTVRAHRAAPKHRGGTVTLPVGAAVDHENVPPLAVAPSTSKAGKAGGSGIYGNGATSKGASILTKTGLSHASANTRAISAPGSVNGLGGSKSSSSGANGSTSAGAGGKASTKGGSGGLSAPGNAPSATARSVPKGAVPGGTPGASSSSGAGSQSGQSQSQKAPPGGDQAGGTRGTTQLAAGLQPDLAQGSSGLPLQAGFAPTAAKSAGHGGISQTANGGGGKARSAGGGSAAAGSGSGRGAQAIEPTSNTSSAAIQPLISDYFGAANQLKPGAW